MSAENNEAARKNRLALHQPCVPTTLAALGTRTRLQESLVAVRDLLADGAA